MLSCTYLIIRVISHHLLFQGDFHRLAENLQPSYGTFCWLLKTFCSKTKRHSNFHWLDVPKLSAELHHIFVVTRFFLRQDDIHSQQTVLPFVNLPPAALYTHGWLSLPGSDQQPPLKRKSVSSASYFFEELSLLSIFFYCILFFSYDYFFSIR